jgi:hypothetical protein
MAKIESTAVNQLIDLVARKPIAPDGDDDLRFTPPNRLSGRMTIPIFGAGDPRAARAIVPAHTPKPERAPKLQTTLPRFRAVKATPPPRIPVPIAPGPLVETLETIAPAQRPGPRPPTHGRPPPWQTASRLQPIVAPPRPPERPTKPIPILPRPANDALDGDVTAPVNRTRRRNFNIRASWRRVDTRALLPKLVIPALVVAIGSMFLTGYLVFGGDGNGAPKLASTPIVPAPIAPTPIIAPPVKPVAPTLTVEPIVEQVPAAKPTIATPMPETAKQVLFESSPSGATVMLVENGSASVVGTTPVNASLDPSSKYDLVLTLKGYPTSVQHLDPQATHVAVALDEPPAAPALTKSSLRKQAAAAKTKQRTKRVAKDKAVATAEPATGNGVLMVSSKPPCAIIVDGKPTSLTTPQRSISLSAGAHKITLVNAQQNIRKTLAVRIKPDQSTKLIQNFMKR